MNRAVIPFGLSTALVAVVVLVLSMGASAHPERFTGFPDPHIGSVPKIRTTGPAIVVCKKDSGRRLRREFRRHPKILRSRLAVLKRCRYQNIQAAVNHARSRYRILVMPGLYLELPSRKVPFTPTQCSDQKTYFDVTEGVSSAPPPAGPASNDPPVRPNYHFQLKCPNARNLIAILGDKNDKNDDLTKPATRSCNRLCHLQLQGMGAKPTDVVIRGDRTKMDVIRADRADGFVATNFTVEQGAFNGLDSVETNGFRLSHLVARWNQAYGVLTFTNDHGLYDSITAYGNGDSGVYPGSGAKGNCVRYSTELRNIDSYGNTLGYSGTAGNSSWIHNSRFHDNAAGISTDSFAAGHPGMPQACAKWENNRIYSNNSTLFNQANQKYCAKTPFKDRIVRHVCPEFQAPEGSGIIMYGADRNTVRNNWIYDNYRSGIRLFHVPAVIRGDNDPADQTDTSSGNQFTGNHFGVSPSGQRLPNGGDIGWDGAGAGNCQQGNLTAPGRSVTFNYQRMTDCTHASKIWLPGDTSTLAVEATCAAWDPVKQTDPPGCNWFTLPPKPE